jgi:hypothetical protein
VIKYSREYALVGMASQTGAEGGRGTGVMGVEVNRLFFGGVCVDKFLQFFEFIWGNQFLASSRNLKGKIKANPST